MRRELLLLIGLGMTGGCVVERQTAKSSLTAESVAPAPSAIVTPATGNRGRIASVNVTARHVVVSYAIGTPLPAQDQRLHVYRAGLKVAELKVSKERIDVNVVADITNGECAVNDEVRTE